MNITNTTIQLNRIILFLLIFNSGGIPFIKHAYITLLTLFLIVINILIQKKYNFYKPIVMIFILSSILLFNFICTYHDQIVNAYFVYISYFLTVGLFLSFYCNTKYDFINDLEKVLLLFMLYAVFSFFMQLLFGNNLTAFMHGEYEARTFSYLVFYPKIETSFIFERTMGLFWEPGILQIYMNILFFISAFITNNKVLSLLSAFIILVTFSTTGLVILIIQVSVLMFSTFRKVNIIKKILVILFTFIISIGLWSVASQNIEEKFEGSSKRSSYARIYDTMTAINIIKEFPICGIGLNNGVYFTLQKEFGYTDTQLITTETENRGGTNAILKITYQFGIPMTLVLLFFIYKQQLVKGNAILFFSIIIISLMSEPLLMSPFMLMFLVSGLQYILFKSKNTIRNGK